MEGSTSKGSKPEVARSTHRRRHLRMYFSSYPRIMLTVLHQRRASSHPPIRAYHHRPEIPRSTRPRWHSPCRHVNLNTGEAVSRIDKRQFFRVNQNWPCPNVMMPDWIVGVHELPTNSALCLCARSPAACSPSVTVPRCRPCRVRPCCRLIGSSRIVSNAVFSFLQVIG